MEIFKQMRAVHENSKELYIKLYELNTQKTKISDEIKWTLEKIAALEPLEGKSSIRNREGRKYTLKQNYSTPKFKKGNNPLEFFGLDELLKFFKVEIKPTILKGNIPEDIRKFYDEWLEESKPTTLSCKIEELEGE